jgi:DnaJ homolog subfamily B member 4
VSIVTGSTAGRRKDPPIEHTLYCTLEDLFKGTTRKLKISRQIVDASTMKTMKVEETLVVAIKPGWKKGTKVTFTEKGTDTFGMCTLA